MQFSKVAIFLGFVSLVSSVPIQVKKPQKVVDRGLKASPAGFAASIGTAGYIYALLKAEGYFDKEAEELEQEDGHQKHQEIVERGFRITPAGVGATAFALTAAYNGLHLNGWFKEAEELNHQHSDLMQEPTPEKRLNAAAMIGLTGGAILKGIFGSKEAADAFLATDEGKEFISKFEEATVL